MMTEQADADNRTWLEKLKSLATGTPASREELKVLLRSAQQKELLDEMRGRGVLFPLPP